MNTVGCPNISARLLVWAVSPQTSYNFLSGRYKTGLKSSELWVEEGATGAEGSSLSGHRLPSNLPIFTPVPCPDPICAWWAVSRAAWVPCVPRAKGEECPPAPWAVGRGTVPVVSYIDYWPNGSSSDPVHTRFAGTWSLSWLSLVWGQQTPAARLLSCCRTGPLLGDASSPSSLCILAPKLIEVPCLL